MNTQMFLENFGPIASAPGGVKRLRAMVLSLGTSGRLGTNIPEEESSEILLASIEVEYNQRLTEKEFRKPASKKKTISKESLQTLPGNWCWCELEQIFYPISVPNSKKLPSNKIEPRGAHPVVDQGFGFISGYSNKNEKLVQLPGPVVVFGDHTRSLKFVDFNFIPGGDGIKILRPIQLFPKYFFLVLQSFDLSERGYARHFHVLLDNYFPLPPIEEQKRIVAKVDELMALCDKLEAQQKERERRFPVLSRACHARFVEAPTLANLKAIFDEAGSVSTEDLRKTVLDLAIQGKLVRQEAGEIVNEELVSRTKSSKNPIKTSEHLFFLPENWNWARLGDIYESSFYGPRFGKNEYVIQGGIPTVRTTDMTMKGEIILRNPPHVEIKDKNKLASYALKANDLLITRSGTIGMMAVFKESYTAIPSAYLIRFRFPESVLADFYYIYLSSRYGLDLLGLSLRSIGVPNVNATSISRFPAPLPPLTEQRRIVAKVNQLMALIDTLEEQQVRKAKVAQAFAQAAVSAITGTEIKEPEKMKAPKTELVSRLQTKNTPNAADPAPLTKLLTEHNGELPAKALWQRSGLEIDAFYQQLRTEMANGWIIEPEKAVMKEIEAD